jgi:hypothetical protein
MKQVPWEKTIHKQIMDKALPLISHYKKDLFKWDRREINGNLCRFNRPFLHYTGDCGTTMIILSHPDYYPKAGEKVPYLFSSADRLHILREKASMARYMLKNPSFRGLMVLYYDGEVLHEITTEKAVEIAECYVDTIFDHWCGRRTEFSKA